MERAKVSAKLKGKLANWYNTLDDKSDHVRQALIEYVMNNQVNLENYKLNNKSDELEQEKDNEPEIWSFPKG